MNVYERTQRRLKTVFEAFDNVYVSFSGGKDSGVLLNLCIDYIRRYGLKRRIGVFHMDYEIQYRDTLSYVDRMLASNPDILDVYRVCVPFKVPTCASMFQRYWRPWEEGKRELWVRAMPAGSYTRGSFPFFSEEMWDYEFQNRFAEWLHRRCGATRTCCLIGIRTQESFNRWRTIYSDRNHHRFEGRRWIRQWADAGICNAYPIYDWLTTDVWTANGRFGWPYNRLYDLFHRAGVPLDTQRVASPFISQALSSLHLYKAIDPDMWGRMIGRVNGVNFAALYGRTSALGWQSARLPKGLTWERYMHFLLATLPAETRRNYLEKLSVSIRFWREKGGCLAETTIAKLRKAGVPIEVGGRSGYRTDKRQVRMEYLDDLDISEFSQLPTFKRICICILKNDHACKYMGFSPYKSERLRRKKIMAANDRYELVDGYHRYLVLKTSKRIYERERGLLPVAVIDKDLSDRMASTIRHNRARGTHNIELMSEIVAELTRAQMSDQWIMRHIGMDRDELLRLKQITGLAALFADREFSLGDADEEAVGETAEALLQP